MLLEVQEMKCYVCLEFCKEYMENNILQIKLKLSNCYKKRKMKDPCFWQEYKEIYIMQRASIFKLHERTVYLNSE